MARIVGAKAHAARLKRIRGAAMQGEVGKAVYAAADIIATEAALSITRGSASGRVDGSKHKHVPSKPGEPPNADTMKLNRELGAAITGPLQAEVISPTPYAIDLEFGTSKMAERPFMRPAVAKKRKEAVDLIRRAVKRVVRGGTL